MRYKVDHDYHIHTQLSACSRKPEQSAERILQYAKANGFSSVCVTDHYWDSSVSGASPWYVPQNFEHIAKVKPLPSCADVRFMFGCETDMDKYFKVGIPPSRFCDFDFVVVPTTHLHMTGFTISAEAGADHRARAKLWLDRLEALLDMPLPFEKVGLAHPASRLINRASGEDYLKVLNLIPSSEMERLFARAAALGLGIELNRSDMSFADSEADDVLRMFRIAKWCGCKFYLGSDSHRPENFANAREIFERAVTLLDLQESDKFCIGRA